MVKLWNLHDLEKKVADHESNPEPYLTLRGHTGPLLAIEGVTGDREQSPNQEILFTAGVEGTIHVWHIPKVSDVKVYGDTQDGKNYCCEIWTDENSDAIWGLKYHPFQDLLLSINANNTIIVWDCAKINKSQQSEQGGQIKKRFVLDAVEGKALQAPTCCAWIPTQQNQFVVGYNHSLIVFFDVNDGFDKA